MEPQLPHQSIEQADDDDSSSKIPTRCIGLAAFDALVAGSGCHTVTLVLVLLWVVLGDAVHAALHLGIETGCQALFGTILAGACHIYFCHVIALLRIIFRVELGLTL